MWGTRPCAQGRFFEAKEKGNREDMCNRIADELRGQ